MSHRPALLLLATVSTLALLASLSAPPASAQKFQDGFGIGLGIAVGKHLIDEAARAANGGKAKPASNNNSGNSGSRSSGNSGGSSGSSSKPKEKEQAASEDARQTPQRPRLQRLQHQPGLSASASLSH